MTIINYSDPGHSWYKVPVHIIKRLGIYDKITSFSYYRRGFVYLEEDCDAALFFDAAKEQGMEVKVRNFHTDQSSRIRSYDFFIPRP